MDYFLHHHRSTRYASLPPPPPPPHQSGHRLHDFTLSQRIPNRILMDPTSPDFHPCNHTPPRVLSDNRHSALDYTIVSPCPPIDNPRYDSEGGSRFRTEHIDACEPNPREDFVRRRGHGNYHRPVVLASNLDAPSTQGALSRDFDIESKFEGYVPLYDLECRTRDRIVESKRFVKHRKPPRDLRHSSSEFGNREIDDAVNGVDFRIVSGKRESYGSELGRYNNSRGIRECAHEFTRTPKKQVLRKSAFLRIQTVKSNHWNREIEQLHCTDYAADTNSNSFRGKYQHGNLGYGMKAEEREGSLVELDISFESNSLVAKAIVAPSSSAIVSNTDVSPVSDTDLTPTGKRKKALISDTVCSDSQLAKLSTGAVSSNSSPCKASDTSSSGKDVILQKNASDTCSQPCSGATHCPHGKNEVAQSSKGIVSDEIANVCSGKTSSRVVKKKRIVKKVVKKVVKSNSNVSRSVLANILDGTVKADSVTLSSSAASASHKTKTSLKEKSTTIDKVPNPDCLQSFPSEGNLLAEVKKGDVPQLTLGTHPRSQECNTDEYSDKGIERSKSSSCASSNEDKKNDSDCLDANNSAHGLLSMPNTDKVTKSLNGSTSELNHTEDVSKQLCQREMSLLPGKYSNEECPQNKNHVGDEMNCKLLSSADNVNDTCNSACDRVARLSSNDLTGKSEENFTVCDIGNDGIVGKAYCDKKAPTLSQDVILEEYPDIAIPVPISGMVGFSSSAKTRIQDGPDCLQHASVVKQGSDNESTNSEGNITFPHCSITNDTQKQVSPSNVAISPENCDTQTFPNSNISLGYGEGDTNKIKKRKVRTHLNFSRSKMESMSPDLDNPVSLANVVDTTLSLLFKDPSPSEVLDQSVQRLDFSSQSSIDGVTTLHGKGGVLEAEFYLGNNGNSDANKVSPLSKKKKVTASPPNFTKCPSELSDAIVATISCAEVPISLNEKQAHEKEVALLSMAILSAAPSVPYLEDIAKLPDNGLVIESSESMDVKRETVSSEHLELQHSGIASHSLLEDSTPNVQFPMLEGDQRENATPIVPINNIETGILVIGNIKGEKIDLQDIEEIYQYEDFVQRSPSADMESNDPNVKDDLLPLQSCMCCPADGDGVTTSNSNDELIETVPDALSDMHSQGITSEVHHRRILDCLEIPNEKFCEDGENLDSRSMIEQCPGLLAFTSSAQHTGKIIKSDHATGHSNPTMRKIMSQPSQVYSEVTIQHLKSYCSELNGSKNQPGCVIPKTLKGHSFIFSKSKTLASSTHISKPRTWHRTGNNSPASLLGSKPSLGTVPPNRPILEKKGNFQNTSYICKGNSLVRKPTPVSALSQISVANQLPSLGLDEFRKSITSESGVDVTDRPNLLKTGITNVHLKGQRAPPPPIDTKSEENRSSPLIETLFIGCCENATEPWKIIENNDGPNSSEDALKYSETPENQTDPSNNGESQVEVNDGNMSSLNAKRIVYIKPKSNQLVATSNSCDLSVSTDDKAQTAHSDGYYKRRKNQLVRTSFLSHISQTVTMPNSNVNSDGLGACKVLCNRRFTKRWSYKVAGSMCKPLKASLVWTLCGKNSSKNDIYSGHYQKVLPQLFPWKRATFLRSFIHNPASSSNSSLLSAISKKLLMLRKRDAVYTRSTHGFSVWKSKVLGVNGSSLKWSKSIERRSRKANEEATLAVAAVDRNKRKQKDAACISSRAKRERIFCIGSVRYRMDPSRRTLQRISDDESLPSASNSSGLAAKEAYIPRRLMIGKNEYVQIGNGNQLIRDPKKRTRLLANEKVRWSLHTARQRLVRKQKYCQFFTRFGKCNKDDGKCPYIHDPSKIVVCTKFLNGSCSNPNCKLTHKIVPERMPDCSYFLQGLCTNRNCPYRHVNVNPKASICEGFLKGYCADGNECRKKHSYVCPTFEATGTCTQGTKCKLHHPNKQGKGRKRKRSGDQNNSRGRYFGSIPVDVSEPGMMVAQRQWQQNNDNEGEIADYISFELDEEVAESVDQSYEQATLCDSDHLDLQLDNLDELIKPVFIMEKNFMAQSSSVL